MKTADEIYAGMKEYYEEASGLALREGGDMCIRLRAAAAQLEALWVQADFTARQSLPQSASGEYLDAHAAVRGLSRTAAVKARGALRFYVPAPREAGLTVPAGVVCMTAAETAFVTTLPAVIAAGELYAEAPAEAAEAGAGGNVPLGSVCLMAQAPAGVSRCDNAAAFYGGADREGDEALRSRVLQSYRSLPNGANAAYYEARALDTDGVAAVSVLPKNRGAGTVDVVIASPSGQPGAALISAVQAKLDGEREICVDIDVLAPAPVTVNVSAAVKAAEGYDPETVKSAVSAAVVGYFTGALLGRGVLRAELCAVIWGTPGVANYSLAVPAADIEADAGTLPVKGEVTVTEMS